MVSDATWQTLATEFDDQQLMDLVFTVGAYEMLAMAFRSFGVELDEDLGGNDVLVFQRSVISFRVSPDLEERHAAFRQAR